jgi:hypothetical protein
VIAYARCSYWLPRAEQAEHSGQAQCWSCENGKASEVVIMSSEHGEPVTAPLAAGEVPVEELARRQGVRPVTSVDDMARPGLFDSDQDLDEFLADLYASRRADVA